MLQFYCRYQRSDPLFLVKQLESCRDPKKILLLTLLPSQPSCMDVSKNNIVWQFCLCKWDSRQFRRDYSNSSKGKQELQSQQEHIVIKFYFWDGKNYVHWFEVINYFCFFRTDSIHPNSNSKRYGFYSFIMTGSSKYLT